MKKKPKQNPISQTEQSKRFIEAAREAGVDESENALEKIVREIAPKKPIKKAEK